MSAATRPSVYTIAPEAAFADALAKGLIDRAGGDPLVLARAQILLPSRRAVRALTDAFVRCAGGGLLLPRMTPLGDIDVDDALDMVAGLETSLLPPIDPIRRRLLLTRLIRRWQAGIGSVEALRLADQLGTAFDTLAREGVDPLRLKDVVHDDLASHWMDTFVFFDLVLEHWPAILAAEGCSDRAARGNTLLGIIAAHWAAAPPPGLVVAAGMNGATPAQAALLGTIARLPNGMLVLPGLDVAMPADAWDALVTDAGGDENRRNSEEHPQYGLKRLLDDIGVARGEVENWPATAGSPAVRAAAVARALCPAAFTAQWRDAPVAAGTFDGVSWLEAADPAAEAQAIALALREALETPGATAALVTPDRNLARRVAAHCARWGIEIDDSAGVALTATPPGALALALAEAAAQHFAPVALLALLKHPLVASGSDATRLDWLDRVRQLDLDLRGVRPAAGLGGIAAQVAEADRTADVRDRRMPLVGWWSEVAALLAPLEAVFKSRRLTLAMLVEALTATLVALTGDAIWRGADGRALADRVAALTAHGDALDDLDPADAPALLDTLLADVPVRPVIGKHPRLAIWGLIEARLQRPDLVILGGLSEGVWPALPSPDPWLAPAVRRRLGLPGLEASIGQAAHDFVAGLGAPRVLLTRARRDDSGPRVASRFWLRLRALAGEALAQDTRLVDLARAIDAAGPPVPAPRPAPAPPAAQRPRRLSVTAAEKLRADPFSFYAQSMLALKVLDPLDSDPTGADRGSAVHRILEEWVKNGGSDAALAAAYDKELADWSNHPLMQALWAPRVRRALDWAKATLDEWDAEGWTPLATEARGQRIFEFGARGESPVTLTGIADRVDRHSNGQLAIVDYKTGTVPTYAQVSGGFALQMGLLGALAEQGVLAGVPAGLVGRFSYWKVSGGNDPGKASDPLSYRGKSEITPAEHIAATVVQFTELCHDLLLGTKPFTAKLHPEYAEKYKDFDHLARVAEWLGKPVVSE